MGIGGKKFFCGRKKKFGLNMQAVCDARRRFLDVEIGHPGATSDYLAFALSGLHTKLQGTNPEHPTLPFLCPGLALFGDNAYINTNYMVVPFKAVSSGPKDAFNFYHSQVRINIECAFGMLVHRWGILRKSIPVNIRLPRTCALVLALCRLHNFCIDENDITITPPTSEDSLDIAVHGGLDLSVFQRLRVDEDLGEGETIEYNHERDRVDGLLDGGQHMEDVTDAVLRRDTRRVQEQAVEQATPLPYRVMLSHIEEQGFQRPAGGRKVR
jgi:hypothetical protein